MNEQMDVAAVDEVFSGREQLTPVKPDREIITVPLDELYPFPGHPFRVVMDADMERLVTSIRNNGVLVPAIVRPRRQGGYDGPTTKADLYLPYKFGIPRVASTRYVPTN